MANESWWLATDISVRRFNVGRNIAIDDDPDRG
jgi:hypothetical protein